jgi:hypothetical protein
MGVFPTFLPLRLANLPVQSINRLAIFGNRPRGSEISKPLLRSWLDGDAFQLRRLAAHDDKFVRTCS